LVYALVTALCTISGIGGGGILNPVIILFFHFRPREAVAISSFAMLIAATTRFLFYFGEKNPSKPHVVLIDYSLTQVMMPAALAGSQIGIQSIHLLPTTTIHGLSAVMLTFSLFFSIYITIQLSRQADPKHRKWDDCDESNITWQQYDQEIVINDKRFKMGDIQIED
jgi:uncharacterized membrane protein YfcA